MPIGLICLIQCSTLVHRPQLVHCMKTVSIYFGCHADSLGTSEWPCHSCLKKSMLHMPMTRWAFNWMLPHWFIGHTLSQFKLRVCRHLFINGTYYLLFVGRWLRLTALWSMVANEVVDQNTSYKSNQNSNNKCNGASNCYHNLHSRTSAEDSLYTICRQI